MVSLLLCDGIYYRGMARQGIGSTSVLLSDAMFKVSSSTWLDTSVSAAAAVLAI